MRCGDCLKWITARRDDYADGTQIFRYQAPTGKGECGTLHAETEAEFGCVKFEPAALPEMHVMVAQKQGAPWQHWQMIPCPQCHGHGCDGDSGCDRCVSTGNVRQYDDGFVGDERTREHPRETEIRQAAQREAIIAHARVQIAQAEAAIPLSVPEQVPGP